MGKCPTASSFVIALIATFVAVDARDAHAQAWVGDKGSLDLGLDYNFATSDKVVVDEGEDFPDAGSTSHQITVSGEFVPLKNLAVNVQLPFVMLKYNGAVDPNTNQPAVLEYVHPGGGEYDDGDYHATLTDLRFGARYQVLDEPVAISPHLAFTVPVADYETIGNTVAGRNLKQLHIGASLGYLIGNKTYTHLFYEFTLSEKYEAAEAAAAMDTKQYSQNRSDLAFTIGRKLFDYKFDIHADLNIRRTHGGVNFSEFASLPLGAQDYHDAILDEDMLLIGAGVGYQISNAVAVNLGARIFVDGQNTQNASIVALGLAWSPIQ